MFSCCWVPPVEHVELKFRLSDGTEIGPFRYDPETTVGQLKASIVSHWPKDKENGPKTFKDVDLFYGVKILGNNMELADFRHAGGHPKKILTMHVVVRPPSDKNKGNLQAGSPTINRCLCSML